MTDILDDTKVDESKLTQADYDRAYKLDAGIKKLAVELEALKDRIKTEHAKKGTFVHGKVIVVVGNQDRKDLPATAKNFPIETYPDHWITPEPVLNVAVLEKADFVHGTVEGQLELEG